MGQQQDILRLMWGLTKQEPVEISSAPVQVPMTTDSGHVTTNVGQPRKDPYVEAIMEVAGRLEAVEDYLRQGQSATPEAPLQQPRQPVWPLWLLALGELLLLGLSLRGR